MQRIVTVVFASLASLAQAGTLVPGGPDRIVQVFHEDGTLASQTTFREGRKVGRHVAYWPGGARRVETTYGGDVIEGVYRTWYPSGQPAELKHYTQGREEGVQKAWTEGGELFLNVEVRNGRPYGLINSKPCLPVQGAM